VSAPAWLLNGAELLETATPGEVGGKAWQLAQLSRFGLLVPDFLVIPAAHSAHRHAAGLPAELLTALDAEMQRRGWSELPLAVRSSAVGEDGGRASFAGIYRSSLNVRGAEQLATAISAVWASLDGDAAAAYRSHQGIADLPAMGVIVMPLVAAVSAGIAFTCDPRDGRHDRLLVHAHWGLGEALVSGLAAGDEYVFVEDAAGEWHLCAQRIGSKVAMSVAAAEGGTQNRPVLAADAAGPVLTLAQAEKLANLLADAAVALDFVAPFYDLEWAWDGSRFWLLQARPVTARPYRTYDALRGQPTIWTRGNSCEVMPFPLTPCDWAFSRWGVNSLLEQGWRLAGYPLLAGVQRAGLFHGYLYLEASILQWEAWDAMGLVPADFNSFLGGHQPTIAVSWPGWRRRLARCQRMLRYLLRAPARRRRGQAAIARIHAESRRVRAVPPAADPQELREQLRQLALAAGNETDLHFLQGSGGGSLSLLVPLLEKAFPGEGEALGAALLAGGEPSVTARQGYDLLELARLYRAAQAASAAAAKKSANIPASDPATDAATNAPIDSASDPASDPEFARAFAAFLATYGHRGHYETYYASPRLREQPELLLAQIEALGEVDAVALRERQQAATRAAWQRVAGRLPWWRRWWLRQLVAGARRECNQREAARSALVDSLAAARHLILASARLAVAQGALAREEDCFMAMPSEAFRFLAGEIAAAAMQARIRARQACYAKWARETAPDWFAVAPDGQYAPAATTETAVAADLWHGVATGTGVARGRVRVLRHPAEAAALQAGEILVAPSTDPGWMPLFLKTAGLVVETGGYLSHGAIVAREFALPAVVNLPGILTQLRDGDEIEVDGCRGTVRRLR
jgi:rifampicin phosphotransferase